MKIRVGSISFAEFNEYISRTIVKTGSIYMGILALIGIAALVFGICKGAVASVLEPVLWFLVFIFIIQVILKLSVRLIYEKSGLSRTACSYTLDGAGLDIKMGKTKGDLAWSYVKKVIETKSAYVMRIPKGTLIMPKRCMDEEAFLLLVKENVPIYKLKFLKKKVKRYGKRKEAEQSGANPA